MIGKDLFGKDGKQIICNKACELIIHKENITENSDGNLEAFLFGSLLIVYKDNDTDEKIEEDEYTLTLGTKVIIPIYTSEQVQEYGDNLHKKIIFEKGDVIIENDEVLASIENVYELFNNFLLGRLSGEIEREKYYDIMMNSIKTNVPLNFPRVFLEMMIAEMFVDSKGKLARLSDGKGGRPLGITDLIQTHNTFNTVTFQDSTKSYVINLDKSLKDQQRDPSVLEKYMKL